MPGQPGIFAFKYIGKSLLVQNKKGAM